MKKQAYVFEHKGKPGVFSAGYSDRIETITKTRVLKKAVYVLGRSEARCYKFPGEVLRQVSLDAKGLPKKITVRHC